MSKKTLVVILDADGSFYNNKFHYLLSRLILQFGKQIESFMEKVELSELRAMVEKMKATIMSANLQDIDTKLISIQDLLFSAYQEAFEREINAAYQEPELSTQVRGWVKCQFIQYLDILHDQHGLDTNIIDFLLCHTNQTLTDHLAKKINDENIQRVIFMVGSNRQSFELDSCNRKRNGTRLFCKDILMYEGKLSEYVNKNSAKIYVDGLLTADLFSNLEPGTSFIRIVDNKKPHAQTIWDGSKMTMIMGICHYLANTYTETYRDGNLLLEFYDDKREIFNGLLKAFRKESGDVLLPDGMEIKMHHYIGNNISDAMAYQIRGTGRVEPGYPIFLNEIAKRCGAALGKMNAINAVDHLNILDFVKFYQKCGLAPEDLSTTSVSASFFSIDIANIDNDRCHSEPSINRP